MGPRNCEGLTWLIVSTALAWSLAVPVRAQDESAALQARIEEEMPQVAEPIDRSIERQTGSSIELEDLDAVARRVRDRVYPALVNISVVHESFGEGRTRRYPGAGSGVILTPEGHVLTNYHVAGRARRVECTLTDGRVLEAEIVVDDPLTDLTVLRLVADGDEVPFPFADLGYDASIEVGDTVFAMGNPLALSSSMTRGIVSNRARVFTDFTGSEIPDMTLEEDQLSGLLTRWIQHDALILPGNSGGPLIDAEGRVLGINELGGRGIGFAIPASIARDVLDQALLRGEIRRGWLGLSVLPVGRLGRDTGALVSSVLPGSAAEAAGVLPGDILTAIDANPVTARFFEEVPLVYQRLAHLEVGSKVAVTIERQGKSQRLEAVVELMPKFKGDEWEVAEFGVTVQEITAPMAISRRFEDLEGLLLTGVRPGSPADGARPRLAPFDVLIAMDGEEIHSPADLRRSLAAVPPGGRAVLEVRRDEERLATLVPAPSSSNSSWGGELPKAWVGLKTQVLNQELSTHLGLDGKTGFRVTQVLPWTEAERSDFRVGDVIVAVDGEALNP
ncbi:MAG: trypsin-like peptidase domain-containing protein, partial [Thermoanaerobaculia bacterium]|nr:trypsin-like peptidase domain-containing protein [Thermoanaerobaculia bacterium]